MHRDLMALATASQVAGVDATKAANLAGIVGRVVIEPALWDAAVRWPVGAEQAKQEADRLWYLVRLAWLYQRINSADVVRFDAACVNSENTARGTVLIPVTVSRDSAANWTLLGTPSQGVHP